MIFKFLFIYIINTIKNIYNKFNQNQKLGGISNLKKESIIDYGEYIVSDELLKTLNKGNEKFKEFSIFAPLSRQEKGIDLILYKKGSNRVATIQVKASRSYLEQRKKKENSNSLWLNNFKIDDEVRADFYFIVGNYLKTNTEALLIKKGLPITAIDYSSIILVYTYEEMLEELKSITKKTKDEPDKFFSYRFRTEDDIELNRGFNSKISNDRSRTNHLLKNKFTVILNHFK